ncbi:MAG: hypothetical protein JWN99_3117 [Ilumatobacteraceae bacterium]|nr:hypothetical protein [Ilumatobacteraceae bacterium]
MTYECRAIEIDSEVFGRATFSVSEIVTAADLDGALTQIDSHNPTSYTTCKVPSERLDLIHAAQLRDFVFLETQLQTKLRLRIAPTGHHDRFGYVKVERRDQLDQVLEIAGRTIEHDRVSRDPLLGPAASGERYRRYLLQSFEHDDEEIWAVSSRDSGRLLTFRSHKTVSPTEVLLLNGGVHHDHKEAGLGVVSSHFCFAQLRAAGATHAVSHISAANVPIINLELGYCNFKVVQSFAVLRRFR